MRTHAEKEILDRLQLIIALLKAKEDKPLNFVEASYYLSLSQSHLYQLTRKKKIPCHKPTGKYLFFFKDELNNWISGKNEKSINKILN